MNLVGLTNGIIGMVNPLSVATIRRSNGYTIADDGSQVPAYRVFTNVPVEVQALSNDDLHQLEGMNIQGNKCAVYLTGDYGGIVRAQGAGGDIFIIAGQTWLASIVLENWGEPGAPDGWVKLALTQQLA